MIDNDSQAVVSNNSGNSLRLILIDEGVAVANARRSWRRRNAK